MLHSTRPGCWCDGADLKGSDATAHQSTVKLVALKEQLAALHTLFTRLSLDASALRLTRPGLPPASGELNRILMRRESTPIACYIYERHAFAYL